VEHYGEVAPGGALGIKVIRANGDVSWPTPEIPWPTDEMTLRQIAHYSTPNAGLPDVVNNWRKANRGNLARGLRKILPARLFGIPHLYGSLFISVTEADGRRVDYGLASLRLVTTVGVKFICDDLNNSATDCSLFKFHGIGIGGTAEAVGDVALVTESTTALNPDNTRATGSQASATVTTNATYTTVGTLTADATIACTEHGIFSQAATGGGTLLDRSLFSVVNLASGDSIQTTYVLTLNAGG
jgi:hypothetical protein